MGRKVPPPTARNEAAVVHYIADGREVMNTHHCERGTHDILLVLSSVVRSNLQCHSLLVVQTLFDFVLRHGQSLLQY